MHSMESARARSRGYSLLAAFMATGLSEAMLPALAQVAHVADALPAEFDAERAAAAHYQLFGRTIFASQSVFLDAAAQRGGDQSARVRAAHAAIGYAPPPHLEADSLACELAALAHLCAAEADAWQDGQSATAARMRLLQATFLAEHLLRWLPPLCEGLAQQPQPLYAAMGALLRGFVDEHAAAVGPLLPAPATPPGLAAPQPASPNTGLADIVAWWVAPAGAGFLLSHEDIQRAAECATLPTPFADRRTTLMQLLRAAGEFDRLPVLLDALEARVEAARAVYSIMTVESSALAPWVYPWDAQAGRTLALLAAMRAQILETKPAAS